MHTLAAFSSSITNGVTYAQMLGVADQSLTLDSGNRIQSPGNWQALAAHVMVPNLSAARLNAPSLRSLVLPQLYPGAPAAAPATLGPLIWFRNRGPRMVSGEYFEIDVSRAGAGALQGFGAVWIAPGVTPAVQGATTTLVATCSITTVIGAWAFANLTFDQTLPAGKYQVVGMAAQVTGGVYARLVYPGGATYRPGVLVNVAYGDLTFNDPFRFGDFGSFGEFVFNAPPSLEVLGSAAATVTATVYLDVVKVG